MSNAKPIDLSDLDFGPCCACGHPRTTVRNIVMLHKRAPVPGTGWGCCSCGLPMDGAIAVICDPCLAQYKTAPNNIRFAADGPVLEKKRIPIDQLTESFDHDYQFHPEAQEEGPIL